MPDSCHLDRRSVLGALGVAASLPAASAFALARASRFAPPLPEAEDCTFVNA